MYGILQQYFSHNVLVNPGKSILDGSRFANNSYKVMEQSLKYKLWRRYLPSFLTRFKSLESVGMYKI